MARAPVNPDALISVTFDPNWSTEFIAATILETKRGTLLASQQIINQEIAAGNFQPDPQKQRTFLRVRGSERRRRSYKSIRAEYLRLPYQIRVVDIEQGVGKMREAALYAFDMLNRRAPYDEGLYTRRIGIYLNGIRVGPNQLRSTELNSDDNIHVGPAVHYALTIERGFARGYYETQHIAGGVVRPIARMVRNQFPGEVSAAFKVLYYPGVPAKHDDWKNIPVVEIGPPGAFPAQDDSLARPGKRTRANTIRR